MDERIIILGVLVIFIGMFLIIAGSLVGKQGRVEWGIGGFIGPIPFGFATNKNMLYGIVAVSLIMLAVYLLFLK
ncbi:MAG: TIGR00304 family protein [Candidatus Aenigmatarchaeota archaeon]|nr:MAG: TIGR00304 family protein [Candidatus Aenigmarchaeota archaeon]